MNAKISVFVICVETIIDLLLYNLHDCTFKAKNSEIKDYTLCYSNISKDFTINNMKKKGLKGSE